MKIEQDTKLNTNFNHRINKTLFPRLKQLVTPSPQHLVAFLSEGTTGNISSLFTDTLDDLWRFSGKLKYSMSPRFSTPQLQYYTIRKQMIILVENTSLSHRRTSKLSRAKSNENCSSWDFHSNDPELIFYVICCKHFHALL